MLILQTVTAGSVPGGNPAMLLRYFLPIKHKWCTYWLSDGLLCKNYLIWQLSDL